MKKETGIIMSGDHPVKIMNGTKTMTRRLWGLKEINKNPGRYSNPDVYRDTSGEWVAWFSDKESHIPMVIKCPYGGVGDLLWVRESYAVRADGVDQILYKADYESLVIMLDLPEFNIKWKPSIHMFRKDSRITREIKGLRAERLQAITEKDTQAEGVNPYLANKFSHGQDYRVFRDYHKDSYPIIDHAEVGDIVRFQGPNMGFASFISKNPKGTGNLNIDAHDVFNYVGMIEPDCRRGFPILWDSLNGKKYPWAGNYWVWVLSF